MVQPELWTADYTIQKLKLDLATFEVDGPRKYYEQARNLIYRIPVYRPTPKFEISLSDLNERMKQEFNSLDRKTLKFILRQAVGRIFEDIDSSYYHTSVSKLLEVVLVK